MRAQGANPTEAELEAMAASATAAAEFHPDGIITVDGDGRIDVVNGRAEIITGITRDRLVGAPLAEGLPLQDMDGRDWWSYVAPWQTLHIVTGHRERTLMLPNGSVVLLTTRYMRNPDGSILALVLSLRDAAGRLRAERATADLLTTVAHELRSPIAGVTGFTRSLLEHWGRFSDEDRQLMLRNIQGDAGRISRLVTELLDVSRIDAQSLTVRPRPVDLEQMLTTQVRRQVASGVAPDRIQVALEDGLPELWADPERREQIVTNLVDNAIRHGAGTVCVAVAPTTAPEGQPGVRLCVSDEGDGIPEEHRELVFSRRWQGGSKAGTGLGLYLVRGLVEAHGGTVRIGEPDDGGTMVVVLLPADGPHGQGSWAPAGVRFQR